MTEQTVEWYGLIHYVDSVLSFLMSFISDLINHLVVDVDSVLSTHHLLFSSCQENPGGKDHPGQGPGAGSSCVGGGGGGV